MTTLDVSLEPIPDRSRRVIRVFVSSTFEDMHEERDELAKWVFPDLRQLCEARGVVWGDVDLRWGITNEQRAEGQVLPICIEEIRKCRPFFIGLLGERYGWDDTEFPADLLEREPWLSRLRGHSITEIEMLHGALNAGIGKKHAFFYLRDPAHVGTASPGYAFRESLRPAEVDLFGLLEAERRATTRQERLTLLKGAIRASRSTVHDYTSPRHCGELVKNDLCALIDQLFPEEERPSDRERERDLHDSVVWSLAEVEVGPGVCQGAYVGRSDYGSRLDGHANEAGPPLVILGESGAGKSALLANWWLRYRQVHPNATGVIHVVGASPQSATASGILARLIAELGASFGGSYSGQSVEELSTILQVFLGVASSLGCEGPLLLILDGLDKLKDRIDDLDLHWLPEHFPPNVRVLIASGPGRACEALLRRGWPTMTIAPLEPEERRELIRRYLSSHRKTLEPDLTARLVESEATAHPVFLRAVLEEIRLLGHPGELDAAITDYLNADTASDLFGRILARLERDYERDRPALVGDAMRFLGTARNGLTDSELLDLLGEPDKPLPMAYWSPLRYALGRALSDRSGILSFSQKPLREAVNARFLGDDDARIRAHAALADYFSRREGEPRSIEELPWQLEQSGQWERLKEVLSRPAYISGMGISDEYLLRRMWAGIEGHTNARLKTVLGKTVDNLSTLSLEMLATLEHLSWSSGDYDTARNAVDELIRRLNPETDSHALAFMLKQSADIHQRLGHREKTLELLRQARDFFNRFTDAGGEASCLRTEAAHWTTALDYERALDCAQRAAEIARRIDDRKGLRADLTNCAGLLTQLSRMDEAIRIHAEEEQLAREMEDWDGLARSFNNQGNLHIREGSPKKALACFEESGRLSKIYANARSRIIALAGQAHAHAELGDIDSAFERSQEARRLSLESQDSALVAHCISVQAGLFHAFPAPRRDQIIAELSHDRDLTEAFRVALRGQERMREHRNTAEEKEIFQRALRQLKGGVEDAPSQARLLIAHATNLLRQDCLQEAKESLEKAEKIAKKGGARAEMREAASDLAGVFKRMGNLNRALTKIRDVRTTAAQDHDDAAEQMALANEATLLWEMAAPTQDRHRLEEAWRLAERSRIICERNSWTERLAFVLGTCGLIARFLDRWDDASKCFERQVSVAREVGDADQLGRALLNCALFNLEAGEHRKAAGLLKELAGIVDLMGDFDLRTRAAKLLRQFGALTS